MLKEYLPLFVGDLANNHSGQVEQGLQIIKEIHKVAREFPFNFGLKLQYRHLDTLIHPDFKNRMDLKYVKRFSETGLEDYQMKVLKDRIKTLGFIAICTPYDEYSVDLAVKHDFGILKIASCSFTDWSLLEKIAETNKPIIASTGGVPMNDIEKVVSFFEHRNKEFALLHCVAEYPTPDNHLQLNQIRLLKEKFPQVIIGYSTHESPDNIDSVKIAIGQGARILEKHVGVGSLNAYSANPEQVKKWMESAAKAFEMCGVGGQRHEFQPQEIKELRGLQRGVFARAFIPKGEKIEGVFLALPTSQGQFTANDKSKYTEFYAKSDIQPNEAISETNATKIETREKVYEIIKKVRKLVADSGVPVPQKVDVEISHHYGIDKFYGFGMTIFTVVNREYCKKLLILLPNQVHPEQYHKIKDETFNLLYGDLKVSLDGEVKELKVGDVLTVNNEVRHSFGTKTGCIIEEISSTHFKEDSYYTDWGIMQNSNRKTRLTYWLD